MLLARILMSVLNTSPPCGNCGSDKMQLVSGGPDTKNNPIQKEYLKLVMLAKETIYIHTPYLVPDQTLKDDRSGN